MPTAALYPRGPREGAAAGFEPLFPNSCVAEPDAHLEAMGGEPLLFVRTRPLTFEPREVVGAGHSSGASEGVFMTFVFSG